MFSLATTLGLRSPSLSTITPNYSPAYLSFHFWWAYVVLAPRHLKQFYGIDRNASPREDQGLEAVKSGKISQKTLDMIRRNTSAQANSIENYVLFVGAIGLASVAGVEAEKINLAGLVYTVSRLVYGPVYILVDHNVWALFRTLAWWTGNISCLWLLRKAGQKMNMV